MFRRNGAMLLVAGHGLRRVGQAGSLRRVVKPARTWQSAYKPTLVGQSTMIRFVSRDVLPSGLAHATPQTQDRSRPAEMIPVPPILVWMVPHRHVLERICPLAATGNTRVHRLVQVGFSSLINHSRANSVIPRAPRACCARIGGNFGT